MKRTILILAALSSIASAQVQSPTEAAETVLARRLKAHAEIIARWDANKDGKLNEIEQTAYHDDRLKEADQNGKQQALAKLDLNKDGQLSIDEFWKVRYPRAKHETVIKMTRVDADNDGMVSEAERQALEERTVREYSGAARREYNDSRMRFDADKDGKLTGAERARSEEIDLDSEIRRLDTNWRREENKDGQNVTLIDDWDGSFSADEKEILAEFIRSNRFALERADTDGDGTVSQDEEEASVLPAPVKRTVTVAGARKLEATLVDTSPFTAKFEVAPWVNSYVPLTQLSADDRKFIAGWSAEIGLVHAFKPVKFLAKDGVEVTGDFYDTGDKSKPVILYAHRAASSRGEYRLIASGLASRGYNGLAVDLRNGKSFAGVPNQTTAAWMAREPKPDPMEVSFMYDRSKPDMEAALQWLKQQGFTGPLILWGSSYSSSLAIILAADDPAVDAVLAFAPGEWLSKKTGKDGQTAKSKETEAASRLNRPVLAVQPERERKKGDPIYQALATTEKTMLMSRDVLHGSNTLLKAKNRTETWESVLKFLASVKDVKGATAPTISGFPATVVTQEWTWTSPATRNRKPDTIRFAADGTGKHTYCDFTWKVTGDRTLTLTQTKHDKNAVLIWNDELTAYSGRDFADKAEIKGTPAAR